MKKILYFFIGLIVISIGCKRSDVDYLFKGIQKMAFYNLL